MRHDRHIPPTKPSDCRPERLREERAQLIIEADDARREEKVSRLRLSAESEARKRGESDLAEARERVHLLQHNVTSEGSVPSSDSPFAELCHLGLARCGAGGAWYR